MRGADAGLLAVLSRHVGYPSCLSFSFCSAGLLPSAFVLFIYFFQPTIHVRRQQVSLFVSGKNWSRRESLLSDTAAKPGALFMQTMARLLSLHGCNLISACTAGLKHDEFECIA